MLHLCAPDCVTLVLLQVLPMLPNKALWCRLLHLQQMILPFSIHPHPHPVLLGFYKLNLPLRICALAAGLIFRSAPGTANTTPQYDLESDRLFFFP